MKTIYALLALACLFTCTTSTKLEARHSRCVYVNQAYVVPAYYNPPQYVYVQQPVQTVVYSQPVQTIVYSQPIYQERVIVRERCNPAAGLITSFALGLGFGLLR